MRLIVGVVVLLASTGVARAQQTLELPHSGLSITLPGSGWELSETSDAKNDVLIKVSPAFGLIPEAGNELSCPLDLGFAEQLLRDNGARFEPVSPGPGWYPQSLRYGTMIYVCTELAGSVLRVQINDPDGNGVQNPSIVEGLEALRAAAIAKYGAPVFADTTKFQLPALGVSVDGDAAIAWKLGKATDGADLLASTSTNQTAVVLEWRLGTTQGCADYLGQIASRLTDAVLGAAPPWLPARFHPQSVLIDYKNGRQVTMTCADIDGKTITVDATSNGPVDPAVHGRLIAMLESAAAQIEEIGKQADTPPAKKEQAEMRFAVAGFGSRVLGEGDSFEPGYGGGVALTALARPNQRPFGGAVLVDVALGYAAKGATFHSRTGGGIGAGSKAFQLYGLAGVGVDGVGLGNDDPALYKVKFGGYVFAEARAVVTLGGLVRVSGSAGTFPRTGINEKRYSVSLSIGKVHAEARITDYGDAEHMPGGRMVQIGVGVAIPLTTPADKM